MPDEATTTAVVEETPASATEAAVEAAPGSPEALAAFDQDYISEVTGKGKVTPEAESTPADAGVAASDASTESEEDPVEAIIKQRYAGDRKAFAASLIHQTNSDARLHEEVARMREEVAALRGGKGSAEEVLQAAIAESPEIQQLDQEIREIQTDTQANHTRALEVIKEHRSAEVEVAKLEGKLEKADDVEKIDIRDTLREAKQRVRDLENEWREKQSILRSNNNAEKRLSRQRGDAVGQVKVSVSERSNEAVETETIKAQARERFDNAFKEGANKYGVPFGSEEAGYIRENIKARITMHLRTIPYDAPAVDLEGMTAKLWEQEAKVRRMSASKGFAQSSAARRETRAPVAQRGTRIAADNPFANVPEATLKDAKFWTERAARLAGERPRR